MLGVRFAGIDVRETPPAALAFTRASASPTPSVSDPGDLIGARFGAVAPAATPSTYILGDRGRIAWAWFGPTSYSQLETAPSQSRAIPPRSQRSPGQGRSRICTTCGATRCRAADRGPLPVSSERPIRNKPVRFA